MAEWLARCKPPKPQQIDRASLERVFAAAAGIDTLIVGSGTEVWLAPATLREALRAVKVVLDVMQTGPAIRTYNIMIGERRRATLICQRQLPEDGAEPAGRVGRTAGQPKAEKYHRRLRQSDAEAAHFRRPRVE